MIVSVPWSSACVVAVVMQVVVAAQACFWNNNNNPLRSLAPLTYLRVVCVSCSFSSVKCKNDRGVVVVATSYAAVSRMRMCSGSLRAFLASDQHSSTLQTKTNEHPVVYAGRRRCCSATAVSAVSEEFKYFNCEYLRITGAYIQQLYAARTGAQRRGRCSSFSHALPFSRLLRGVVPSHHLVVMQLLLYCCCETHAEVPGIQGTAKSTSHASPLILTIIVRISTALMLVVDASCYFSGVRVRQYTKPYESHSNQSALAASMHCRTVGDMRYHHEPPD